MTTSTTNPTSPSGRAERITESSDRLSSQPEWYRATIQHEIERLRKVLRDPRATAEEQGIARSQLRHYENLELDAR